MYEDQESVHVVMELCRGGDLFDLIKQAKRLREVDAAWLFRSEVLQPVSVPLRLLVSMFVTPGAVADSQVSGLSRSKV